jgi:hypothetical protein
MLRPLGNILSLEVNKMEQGEKYIPTCYNFIMKNIHKKESLKLIV